MFTNHMTIPKPDLTTSLLHPLYSNRKKTYVNKCTTTAGKVDTGTSFIFIKFITLNSSDLIHGKCLNTYGMHTRKLEGTTSDRCWLKHKNCH